MLGIGAIVLFSLVLVICLLLKISIVYALLIGSLIFISYGLITGHSLKKLLDMSFRGVKTVKNVVIVFMLIGMITALWRASGTIAFIVFYGSKMVTPSIFIFIAFFLCSILSLLIGTSLGTAATMGVICISIARAMGINEFYVAGAVLSGIYLGDRNSPMSTSALLVAEITKTDLYENIKEMIKTSIIPFILTSVLYIMLGFFSESSQGSSDISVLFSENYNLNILTLTPAILIIALSLFKINVKITMIVSILTAFIISFIFQKESIFSLINYTIYGYSHSNEILNNMMRGGGILSMINVSLIVGISSSYSGIFAETDILKKLKEYIKIVAEKITAFGAILVTSIITAGIACNQSLSSILTNQLCEEIMPTKKRAIALENTVILVAALIPWSIAMAVPFRALEVGNISAIYAFYLYLVPLWNFYEAIKDKKNLKS